MFKFKTVYLAGPMGQDGDSIWRNKATELLGAVGIKCLNPIDFESSVHTPCQIVNLDKYAIKDSDLVLANVSRHTPGTSMEIMYAFEIGVPVFIAGLPELISPWHKVHATFMEDLMYDAIRKIIRIANYEGEE